ncbi:MFS transporter [Priestia megaterium]|uniref:MFS transporter n=1 Tax=Priestia megaterium TaxID=1404 RepID=UPI0012D96466|nr:MFS transporter [Priestia megaterium]MUL34449.1 enterobactin exporter EntS [Priestia megaterium]
MRSTDVSSNHQNNFSYVWIANLLSIFTTLFINFSLGLWILEEYHSTISYTLVYMFTYLPSILLSPILGAKVDKMNEKKAHLIAIGGLILNTLLLLITFQFSLNSLVYIYIFISISSSFNTLQWSAFQKIVPLLLEGRGIKEITKANGSVQSVQSLSFLLVPILSALLVDFFSLNSLVIFSLILYSISYIIFSKLEIKSKNIININKKTSTWNDIGEAFKYIKKNKSINILIQFFTFNFFLMGILNALLSPFILSFTNKRDLATVLSISGLGMVLGSLFVSKWGGPRKRIMGVIVPTIFLGIFTIIGGIKESLLLISISGFFNFTLIPVIRGCGTSIIQTNTPYTLVGRVLSISRMLSISALPIAYLISGIIVDYLFKPFFDQNTGLSLALSHAIGNGESLEIRALFIILGFATIILGVCGMISPNLRRIN